MRTPLHGSDWRPHYPRTPLKTASHTSVPVFSRPSPLLLSPRLIQNPNLNRLYDRRTPGYLSRHLTTMHIHQGVHIVVGLISTTAQIRELLL